MVGRFATLSMEIFQKMRLLIGQATAWPSLAIVAGHQRWFAQVLSYLMGVAELSKTGGLWPPKTRVFIRVGAEDRERPRKEQTRGIRSDLHRHFNLIIMAAPLDRNPKELRSTSEYDPSRADDIITRADEPQDPLLRRMLVLEARRAMIQAQKRESQRE